MILAMNENGEFEEYKESYASVDFKTEEDYKRFEEILKYYNNREEHDRQIRVQAIDDVMKKAKEMQEKQIKNLEQSPRNSGKRWAQYMTTHLGHIQVACKRLIADHPVKESED